MLPKPKVKCLDQVDFKMPPKRRLKCNTNGHPSILIVHTFYPTKTTPPPFFIHANSTAASSCIFFHFASSALYGFCDAA